MRAHAHEGRESFSSFSSFSSHTHAGARTAVERGAPALARRDADVAELCKVCPQETEGQLRTCALQEDPSKYEEYRRLTAS